MTFNIRAGVNISHWLSQSKRRGDERRDYFVRDDMRQIAAAGFDHIRLPVDEEHLWLEDGQRDTDGWDLLQQGLQWAADEDLRVVLDLHILRSHYFNSDDEPELYQNPDHVKHFHRLWHELSDRFCDRPNDFLAYEFLNEPVARDPAAWNRIVNGLIGMMRKREPERTLVVGSNDFQDVSTFPELRVPTGDPAMLLSFHFYKPMLITHYRARWAKFLKDYDGPIAYPGRVLPPDRLDSFPDEYRDVVETQGGEWDRGRIDREVAVAQDRANELGYPCYCGEFGVRTVVPPELRLAWYRDMVDVLKTRNIAYATWDWKGGFAVKDRKTDVLDRELADILTASS